MIKKYLLAGGLIAVILLFGLFLNNFLFTGKVIQENEYSWTKAICASGKCQDVEVVCRGGLPVRMIPVSDFKYLEGVQNNLNDNLCG